MNEIALSPNSRFRVSSSPELPPGKCAVCGSCDSDREYLDFGFSLDMYGVVYFCTHCLIEVAKATGFVHAESLKDSEDMFRTLNRTYTDLVKEYRGYRDTVKFTLSHCHCDDGNGGGVLSVGDSESVVSKSEAEFDDGSEFDSDGETGSGE